MAAPDVGDEPPPIVPRPMVIRVLAALAIVAILGLSMWAVLRAGHNLNHKVTRDRSRSAFQNRVVEADLPSDTPIPAGAPQSAGKRCADLVDQKHWFWDRGVHRLCYLLGPSVLDGNDVTKATASYNPQGNGWGIDVTYRDDLFVEKIARPYAGKQFAILFNNEVISAPVVEAGITGSVVRVSGALTEPDARTIAKALGGS